MQDGLGVSRDIFADTGGLAIVGLPGFGIVSCPLGDCVDDPDFLCSGPGANILEFESGIRVD